MTAKSCVCVFLFLAFITGCSDTTSPPGTMEQNPIAWGSKGGASGEGDGEFNQPEGLAIGADGNLYVSDVLNGRIQVFDAAGRFLRKWDVPAGCWGIAANDSGNIYAASATENRIVKYDAYGTELTGWGAEGSGPGDFHNPKDIEVDRLTNQVFVLDYYNSRLQVFTSNGVFLDAWNILSLYSGIAIDNDGYIYVTVYHPPFVRKYLRTGEEAAAWGPAGTGPGEFLRADGIAVDGQSNVYVSDTGTHRVQKFDSDGTFICAWGEFGSKDSEFCRPADIAVADDGSIYVSDLHINHRIQQFDANGRFLAKIGKSGVPDNTFLEPLHLCVDKDGYVYVVDDQRVKKFDCNGNFVIAWGGLGDDPEDFFNPEGIAVYKTNIYVVDRENYRIKKFDRDGQFITMWGHYGPPDGEFERPECIAVDRSGNVYVSDSSTRKIQKFSESGAFLSKFYANAAPYALAIDDGGYLYITDRFTPYAITKYDPQGNEVAQWGSKGAGPGQFDGPAGVTIGPKGNVYVSDYSNNRVQKFDNDGNYITAYDLLGTDVGGLHLPSDVACWSNYLFIADSYNYRIVRARICNLGDCLLQ